MYRVQGLGVHYIQSVGFRYVLHTECRVQDYPMYRVQGLGVHYIQSVGFRPDIVNAGSGETGYSECRVRRETRYSECRVRGDRI
ncbi:unnamed protein product [Staurois parvus]|uniref:Uncharacterized protein n=1 Tax=Staurois parvus TaxID=386267 RepID=A0ABN9D1D7_9NEOB|nr:unnamed protein product [Staurois parvus]